MLSRREGHLFEPDSRVRYLLHWSITSKPVLPGQAARPRTSTPAVARAGVQPAAGGIWCGRRDLSPGTWVKGRGEKNFKNALKNVLKCLWE